MTSHKPYESPTITRLGSVADFTRGDSGHGAFDSASFTHPNGATGTAFWGTGPTS